MNATAVFESEDRRNVRVIDGRQDLRFALESRKSIRIVGERWRQDLDRDVAIQLGIAGAVDLTHPADSNQGVDPVRPDEGPRLHGGIIVEHFADR